MTGNVNFGITANVTVDNAVNIIGNTTSVYIIINIVIDIIAARTTKEPGTAMMVQILFPTRAIYASSAMEYGH